jgi:hypothetical protein
MSTERDVTHIVESWLEEGVTVLPDRVLDNVLDQLPATPQRRAWWPAWRTTSMNTSLRIALAAAAVVVVAVVGLNLVPRSGGIGVPVATATPAPTPSPTPSPASVSSSAPSPRVASLPGEQMPIVPGTYGLDDPFELPVALTIGSGWTSWSGSTQYGMAIYKDSPDPPAGKGIIVIVVDDVYADVCDPSKGPLTPRLGPTVDDLVAALSSQPGTTVSPPEDVSVAGYSGKILEYTATGEGAGCEVLHRWPTLLGDRQALPNEHDRLWILDVDGVRLVIDAFSFSGASAADLAEIEAIVQTLEVGR